MTDDEKEVVTRLSGMASSIAKEKEKNPNLRADRLELGYRYLVCCGILSGEIDYATLSRITSAPKP